MRYLSIKNFKKHQHYTNRRPPWIKLHVEVLDDYAFSCLQDASKAHLMLLWVLASKMDNKIPYDLAFLSKKLGTTAPVDVEELVLQGFIEISQDDSTPLASRKQSAMPETERERETEAETETSPAAGAAKVARSIRVVRPSPEVEAVLAHYVGLHPRRNPGPKDRKAVEKALALGYTPDQLCDAISGNAGDPWHIDKKKHELTYVFRDNGQIDNFREKFAAADKKPFVVDGWFAA